MSAENNHPTPTQGSRFPVERFPSTTVARPIG